MGQSFHQWEQRPTDKSSLPLADVPEQQLLIRPLGRWRSSPPMHFTQVILRTNPHIDPLPPLPASYLLLPGTTLNKVLAHKPLPQILFSGEPRLRRVLSGQSWRPEEPMCSWLRLARPGEITVMGGGAVHRVTAQWLSREAVCVSPQP